MNFITAKHLERPKIKTLLSFTVMVLWLYLFPLSGQMIADGSLLKWFMLTSAATFWVLAHIDTRHLNRRLKWAAVLTLSFIGLIFLDLSPFFCTIALLLLGICSATISAFVGTTLSKETVIYAVIGIVLGNLLSYLPGLLELSSRTTIYLASLLNLSLLALNLQMSIDPNQPHGPKRFGNQFGIQSVFYLFPFILFFELLAGIMYSQIWPAYLSQQDALPGIDLIPYIIALFAGYFILSKNLLLNLILAVWAAIISFIIWFYAEHSLYTVYALCFMILAAGFVDVSIIFSAARAEETFRAYVLLQGSVLLGISLGNFIFAQIAIDYRTLSLIGLIIVNISLITLLLLHFYFGHRFKALTAATPTSATVDNEAVSEQKSHTSTELPPEIKKKLLMYLSDQEYNVVSRVLLGFSYKEIAIELGVSESTVKTYMQRIYKKLGVYNLSKLKQKFE